MHGNKLSPLLHSRSDRVSFKTEGPDNAAVPIRPAVQPHHWVCQFSLSKRKRSTSDM